MQKNLARIPAPPSGRYHASIFQEVLPVVLSQKTRYALKALLELSGLPPGATLSSAAIAARRTIPVKFLEGILVELKRGGLVRGQRGRAAGTNYAQSAEAISFGAVVRLVEGPLALLPCVSQTQYRRCEDCTDSRICELRILFREVRDSSAAILDGWSLADARRNASPSEGRSKASITKKGARRKAAEKQLIAFGLGSGNVLLTTRYRNEPETNHQSVHNWRRGDPLHNPK